MLRLAILLIALLAAVCSHANYIDGEKLFLSPQVSSLSLSPDESHALGIYHGEKKQYVVATQLETMQSQMLFYLEESGAAKVTEAWWVENDIIYIKFMHSWRGKRHGFVYMSIDESGRESWKFEPIRAFGNIIDPLPDDRDKMLFAFSSTVNPAEMRLYYASLKQIQNATFSSAKEFAKPLEDAVAYYPGTFGNKLLAVAVRDDVSEVWGLDSTKGHWVKLYSHKGEDHVFTPVGFIDKNTLAVLTNKGGARVALRKYNVDSQTLGKVLYEHPKYDLAGAKIAADGSRVESVSYFDHGRRATEYFRFSSKVLDALLQEVFPGKVVTVVAGDGVRRRIVRVAASDSPGEFYIVNLDDLSARLLTKEYPELADVKLAKTEVFEVHVDDDIKVEALLTRPLTGGSGVLLVNPHGGPIGVRDTAEYSPETQYLVNRGYSVLQVNFRGSFGFGREFQDAGKGQFGRAIEQDISSVVEQVRDQYDFPYLCSIGASYGGYSAIMLAVQNPEQYDCVVSMYGIYDLPLLFNYSNIRTLESVRKKIAQVVGDMNSPLREKSLLHNAQAVSTPLLLIAGHEDRVSGIEQANRLKYRLRNLGKEFEPLFYLDAGHGHSDWRGDMHQYYYINDFIRRKFGLSAPEDAEDKRLYTDELVLIGDSFRDGSAVDQDEQKAWDYYERAAEYGSATALSRLARFYIEGRVVTRDLSKALALYQKSAAMGDPDGQYWLGVFVRDGVFGEVDDRQAFGFFKSAYESGSQEARYALAISYCLGRGVQMDSNKCLGLLNEPPLHRLANRATRRQAISEIIQSDLLSANFKNKLWPIVEREHEVARLDAKVRLNAKGRYTPGYARFDSYKYDGDTVVQIEPGMCFGINVIADGAIPRDSEWRNTLVKVTRTYPPYRDKLGRVESRDTRFRSLELNEYNDILMCINEENVNAGDWAIQIFNMEDDLLLEQRFSATERH